jgi:hypothetical protein
MWLRLPTAQCLTSMVRLGQGVRPCGHDRRQRFGGALLAGVLGDDRPSSSDVIRADERDVRRNPCDGDVTGVGQVRVPSFEEQVEDERHPRRAKGRPTGVIGLYPAKEGITAEGLDPHLHHGRHVPPKRMAQAH